jgi:hypothetical protein
LHTFKKHVDEGLCRKKDLRFAKAEEERRSQGDEM